MSRFLRFCRKIVNPKVPTADEVVHAFYAEALQIRSEVLEANPSISQESYSLEVGRKIVNLQNGLLLAAQSDLAPAVLADVRRRILKIGAEVMGMTVRHD